MTSAARDIALRQFIFSNLRDNGLVGAASAAVSRAGARDQIGHHGERNEHKHSGEKGAYRFIAAAKQIKHVRENLVI